jgi:hypothetical protein
VKQCVEVGLVRGKELSVDGSFVEANAAKQSRIPREQLAEAAEVHYTARQYLRDVEQQNLVEEPVHEQDQVSTTDPDSTYATKGGTPARLGYYNNYLVDNDSCVIVGVQATAPRMSQETVAAQDPRCRSRRDCDDFDHRSSGADRQGRDSDLDPVCKRNARDRRMDSSFCGLTIPNDANLLQKGHPLIMRFRQPSKESLSCRCCCSR